MQEIFLGCIPKEDEYNHNLGVYVYPYLLNIKVSTHHQCLELSCSLHWHRQLHCTCFFDGVKAKISNMFLTTIPMSFILVANAILYALTYYRIQSEAKRLQHSLGASSSASRASHRAARNMILFLLAFFVQWWAATVFGIWLLFQEPPMILFQMVTTFSNIGGVLNGITYAIIRRRQTTIKPDDKTKGNSQNANSSCWYVDWEKVDVLVYKVYCSGLNARFIFCNMQKKFLSHDGAPKHILCGNVKLAPDSGFGIRITVFVIQGWTGK